MKKWPLLISFIVLIVLSITFFFAFITELKEVNELENKIIKLEEDYNDTFFFFFLKDLYISPDDSNKYGQKIFDMTDLKKYGYKFIKCYLDDDLNKVWWIDKDIESISNPGTMTNLPIHVRLFEPVLDNEIDLLREDLFTLDEKLEIVKFQIFLRTNVENYKDIIGKVETSYSISIPHSREDKIKDTYDRASKAFEICDLKSLGWNLLEYDENNIKLIKYSDNRMLNDFTIGLNNELSEFGPMSGSPIAKEEFNALQEFQILFRGSLMSRDMFYNSFRSMK